MSLIIEDLPDPPQHVFHLATPAHMLNKLGWEIRQLTEHLKRAPHELWGATHIAYSAFNTAVTAWHCADWAWRFGDQEIRGTIADKLAFDIVSDERTNPTCFLNAAAKRCRAIHICRQIANGSKHMGADRGDPVIEAAVVWQFVADHGTDCYLTIRDGADTFRADEIFREAFSFWEHLFGDIGYIEGRFVGPDS